MARRKFVLKLQTEIDAVKHNTTLQLQRARTGKLQAVTVGDSRWMEMLKDRTVR